MSHVLWEEQRQPLFFSFFCWFCGFSFTVNVVVMADPVQESAQGSADGANVAATVMANDAEDGANFMCICTQSPTSGVPDGSAAFPVSSRSSPSTVGSGTWGRRSFPRHTRCVTLGGLIVFINIWLACSNLPHSTVLLGCLFISLNLRDQRIA